MQHSWPESQGPSGEGFCQEYSSSKGTSSIAHLYTSPTITPSFAETFADAVTQAEGQKGCTLPTCPSPGSRRGGRLCETQIHAGTASSSCSKPQGCALHTSTPGGRCPPLCGDRCGSASRCSPALRQHSSAAGTPREPCRGVWLPLGQREPEAAPRQPRSLQAAGPAQPAPRRPPGTIPAGLVARTPPGQQPPQPLSCHAPQPPAPGRTHGLRPAAGGTPGGLLRRPPGAPAAPPRGRHSSAAPGEGGGRPGPSRAEPLLPLLSSPSPFPPAPPPPAFVAAAAGAGRCCRDPRGPPAPCPSRSGDAPQAPWPSWGGCRQGPERWARRVPAARPHNAPLWSASPAALGCSTWSGNACRENG